MRMEELKSTHATLTWEDAAAFAVLCGLAVTIICGALAVIPKASAQSHAAPAVAERPVPTLPTPMIRVPAFVNEVHDGDTVTVHIEFSMRVRLIDCWAPELREGEPGRRSKANLIKLAAQKPCMVEVPLWDDIGKSTSLGRILGRVTVQGQDSDLSTQQVQCGFATRKK